MKNKTVKYICLLLSIFVVATGALCAVAYGLDPQNVYRWNTEGTRYFNSTYSTAPAIRTYDYDYVIIGSSMVQNFDAQQISDDLGCKPLKLAIGAMEPREMMWLYSCAQEQDKADKYIINIDLHRFASSESVEADSGRFPEHMYTASGISQFKYLIGYETWFRFIPLQLILTATDTFNIQLPSSFQSTLNTATDINLAGAWDETNTPGEEKLFDDFNKKTIVFNEGDSSSFNKNAKENMNSFLNELASKLDGDEEITIYLPPYSSLYWADKSDEQLNVLFELRIQIAEFAKKHDNIHLCDLQAESYTADLNLYMDTSHYGADIRKAAQNAVISCTGEPTPEQIKQSNSTIKANAENAFSQAQARKNN